MQTTSRDPVEIVPAFFNACGEAFGERLSPLPGGERFRTRADPTRTLTRLRRNRGGRPGVNMINRVAARLARSVPGARQYAVARVSLTPVQRDLIGRRFGRQFDVVVGRGQAIDLGRSDGSGCLRP